MADIFNIVLRALFFYVALMFIMRLMGKREIGQLQAFEVIVLILIGEVAAGSISDIDQPTLPALMTILTLVIAQNGLGLMLLKWEKLRKFVSGTPSVLIENGVIREEALRRQHYNLTDLIEELRANGCFSVSEVAYAVLETSWRISVQPAADQRLLAPKDLHMPGDAAGVPYVLVMDGKMQPEALRALGKDALWLENLFRDFGLPGAKSALLATLDRESELFIQTKGEYPVVRKERIRI